MMHKTDGDCLGFNALDHDWAPGRYSREIPFPRLRGRKGAAHPLFVQAVRESRLIRDNLTPAGDNSGHFGDKLTDTLFSQGCLGAHAASRHKYVCLPALIVTAIPMIYFNLIFQTFETHLQSTRSLSNERLHQTLPGHLLSHHRIDILSLTPTRPSRLAPPSEA
jgi:hypothetical protein